MALDTAPCPAHSVGHYVITIGRVTFCMDCGKVYSPKSARLAQERANAEHDARKV